MSFEITLAKSSLELAEILQLQSENHRNQLSEEKKAKNGFLSVIHSFEVLEEMNKAAPQVIAKSDDHVIGFALVMLDSFQHAVPELVSLFETLKMASYKGKMVIEYNYYVMGQICIDEKYRSLGIFDQLYAKHKEIYSSKYDILVTEISSSNVRSMKAHLRVGFEIVHTFKDNTDEWNIVVWDWK